MFEHAVPQASGTLNAVVGHDGSQPQPAPAPPTPAPTTSEAPDTTTLGIWAASLPHGAPPEVAYLAGTTVVEPDGRFSYRLSDPRLRVIGDPRDRPPTDWPTALRGFTL